MIDNVMKMNIEEFRQQVKELSVEQHLLLSGWVYGFTDQAQILRGRSSCTPILLQHKRVGSSVLWAPLRLAVWIFTCRS